jgi:hypothetical protein
MKIRPLALAACMLCAACGGKSGDVQSATPQPSTGLLIQSRGVMMPLAAAVREADFSPFIPSAQIAGVAVIPPLSSDENKRHPGIAIEYENSGDALLLSQWPRAGLNITVGSDDVTHRPCAPVAYKADGLLWTTRTGRVMTLQPDGAVLPSRIAREADRLLRGGACGGRIGPTFPSPPRSSPVVSSPRRSAS